MEILSKNTISSNFRRKINENQEKLITEISTKRSEILWTTTKLLEVTYPLEEPRNEQNWEKLKEDYLHHCYVRKILKQKLLECIIIYCPLFAEINEKLEHLLMDPFDGIIQSEMKFMSYEMTNCSNGCHEKLRSKSDELRIKLLAVLTEYEDDLKLLVGEAKNICNATMFMDDYVALMYSELRIICEHIYEY